MIESGEKLSSAQLVTSYFLSKFISNWKHDLLYKDIVCDLDIPS